MDEAPVVIGYRANQRSKTVTGDAAAKSKLQGGSVSTDRKMAAGNSSTMKASDGQKLGRSQQELAKDVADSHDFVSSQARSGQVCSDQRRRLSCLLIMCFALQRSSSARER